VDLNNLCRAAAFIMGQIAPRTSPIMGYLTTVDEIEQRSGLDFFWQLPAAEQNVIESTKNEAWFLEWFN
jgi:endonuclease G